MQKSQVMGDLVSRHSGDDCSTVVRIDQIVADMHGDSTGADKCQSVADIFAGVAEAWNSFDKVQINHATVRTSHAGVISTVNDSPQVRRRAIATVSNIHEGIVDGSGGQEFDVDVCLCKNQINPIFDFLLLLIVAKKFSGVGTIGV